MICFLNKDDSCWHAVQSDNDTSDFSGSVQNYLGEISNIWIYQISDFTDSDYGKVVDVKSGLSISESNIFLHDRVNIQLKRKKRKKKKEKTFFKWRFSWEK